MIPKYIKLSRTFKYHLTSYPTFSYKSSLCRTYIWWCVISHDIIWIYIFAITARYDWIGRWWRPAIEWGRWKRWWAMLLLRSKCHCLITQFQPCHQLMLHLTCLVGRGKIHLSFHILHVCKRILSHHFHFYYDKGNISIMSLYIGHPIHFLHQKHITLQKWQA